VQQVENRRREFRDELAMIGRVARFDDFENPRAWSF
jgi:hypothetical protein